MKPVGNGYMSIDHIKDTYLKDNHIGGDAVKRGKDAQASPQVSFKDVLSSRNVREIPEKQAVKFSKHALGRLTSRNIELTSEQVDRLNQGVEKAGVKGIRESLVLVDQLAFIVNIPNNTVVTAMDKDFSEENIFTNIDGAVII